MARRQEVEEQAQYRRHYQGSCLKEEGRIAKLVGCQRSEEESEEGAEGKSKERSSGEVKGS